MPNLQDPYFSKTVILLCNYDQDGAFGLVMNQPSTLQVKEVLTDAFKDHPAFEVPLLVGGPVQPESFWAVHTNDFEGESTSRLSPGLNLSAAPDVLKALIEDHGPSQYHLGCGYAGWGAKQLDHEIEDESWWLGPLEQDLLLSLDYPARWETLLQRWGIDPLQEAIQQNGYV